MMYPGHGLVEGELYSVSEDHIKNLDIIEDEGNLYHRITVKVVTPFGEIDAQTYVGQESSNWYKIGSIYDDRISD